MLNDFRTLKKLIFSFLLFLPMQAVQSQQYECIPRFSLNSFGPNECNIDKAGAPQPDSEIVNSGVSQLYWPFSDASEKWKASDLRKGSWWLTPGSEAHFGDDKHADDWNHVKGGNNDVGEKVYAVGNGTVIFSGYSANGNGVKINEYFEPGAENCKNSDQGWYGNQVIIQFDDDKDFAVRYAHLNSVTVRNGTRVLAGQEIGEVGCTGLSGTGQNTAHLHIVLYKNLSTKNSEGKDPIERLKLGAVPQRVSGGATVYAADFNVFNAESSVVVEGILSADGQSFISGAKFSDYADSNYTNRRFLISGRGFRSANGPKPKVYGFADLSGYVLSENVKDTNGVAIECGDGDKYFAKFEIPVRESHDDRINAWMPKAVSYCGQPVSLVYPLGGSPIYIVVIHGDDTDILPRKSVSYAFPFPDLTFDSNFPLGWEQLISAKIQSSSPGVVQPSQLGLPYYARPSIQLWEEGVVTGKTIKVRGIHQRHYFAPRDEISVAEAVTIAIRALDVGLIDSDNNGCSCAPSGEWYTRYMCAAERLHLLDGTNCGTQASGTDKAVAKMQRGRFAELVAATLRVKSFYPENVSPNYEYSDIPEQYKASASEPLNLLRSLGIACGTGGAKFGYSNRVNRGDVATIAVRARDQFNLGSSNNSCEVSE